MLYTKFCGNRSGGSGEDDFKGVFFFFTIYAWSCDQHHVNDEFSIPCS